MSNSVKQNLCIIFRSWHVTGTMSLIGSLLAIILLTAGYELVRELTRRYETISQQEISSLPRKFNYPSIPRLSVSSHFSYNADECTFCATLGLPVHVCIMLSMILQMGQVQG